MSIRKSTISLLILTVLFLGILGYYVWGYYIWSPIYLGYDPFGIIQFIIFLGCLTAFFLFAKENLFIHYKKTTLKSLALLVGYATLIGAMLFTLFLWFSFRYN